MRRLLPLILVLAGFVVLPPLLQEVVKPALPAASWGFDNAARRLPAFTFFDATRKPLMLSHFRGSYRVVNIWATWCGPCRAEMISLNHLAEIMAGEKLKIIPISIDLSGAFTVQNFYKRLGLSRLPVYVDPSRSAMSVLAIAGIPTTLIIDPGGREVGRVVGAARWDAPVTLARFSKLLGSKSSLPLNSRILFKSQYYATLWRLWIN